MSKNRLSSADGPGFLRAFCDNWVDTETDHNIQLHLTVCPSARKGVLEHRISAWRPGDDRTAYPRASYVFEYPTAQVQTYEAAYFQAIVRLIRILDQQRAYPEGKG